MKTSRIICAAALACSVAHAQTVVSVSEIPAFSPGAFCETKGLNESGQVLAVCGGSPGPRSYVWSIATQTMHQIRPDWSFVLAWGINNLGQVIAFGCQTVPCTPTTFIWTTDGTFNPLAGVYTAYAINDLGEVVGWTSPSSGYRLIRPDATSTPISIPPGYQLAQGQFFNNLSQVALTGGGAGAVWSPNEGFVPLPPPPPGCGGTLFSINDAGKIISGGCLFSPGIGYSPFSGGFPVHLNALNQAVGGVVSNGSTSAILWRMPWEPHSLGRYQDLQTHATVSNSVGQVIGDVSNGAGVFKKIQWQVQVDPPAASQQIREIEMTIAAYVQSGVISSTVAKSLSAKLDGISKAADESDVPAVQNLLKALGNQLRAFVDNGRIGASAAATLQALIDAASN